MQPPRRRVLMIEAPRHVRFHELTLPSPGPRDVVVKPRLSSFKHGTEMMAYSGGSPFATRRFNPELRLFEDRGLGDNFYPRPMGSMTVGEVVLAGRDVHEFKPGQHVYAWAPIADIHVLPEEKVFPLGDLTPDQALCIDPASFALGALLDGEIRPSERVLVTGLGAIGLFGIQYGRVLGGEIFAASHFKARRILAASFGAVVYDPASDRDWARAFKQQTGGADVAIECSGNLATLQASIRAVRQCGRVVCAGFYGPADTQLNLGEEFFHNRISLLASLPAFSWGNPVRGATPARFGDLQQQVVEDFRSGKIEARGIIDPVLPFRDALRAVERIAKEPKGILKIALQHDENF